MCERPDELRADLMEAYGVCLDTAERDYPAEFVAALAAQLPQDCRWRVAVEPDTWWTGDRMLAANLVNSLNLLLWAMGDRKRRGPRPKPVGPSRAGGGRGRSLRAVPMGRDELLRELSKPRKEGGGDG